MRGSAMKQSDVRARAFAMPLTSPAYPMGPYRFVDREFLIVTYRTDPQKLRELVPELLQIEGPLVKFEFIRMPDSTGSAITPRVARSSRSPFRAARAAIRIACFSTTIRRSPAAAS